MFRAMAGDGKGTDIEVLVDELHEVGEAVRAERNGSPRRVSAKPPYFVEPQYSMQRSNSGWIDICEPVEISYNDLPKDIRIPAYDKQKYQTSQPTVRLVSTADKGKGKLLFFLVPKNLRFPDLGRQVMEYYKSYSLPENSRTLHLTLSNKYK